MYLNQRCKADDTASTLGPQPPEPCPQGLGNNHDTPQHRQGLGSNVHLQDGLN